MGHPVGATGVRMLRDAALQVTGLARKMTKRPVRRWFRWAPVIWPICATTGCQVDNGK